MASIIKTPNVSETTGITVKTINDDILTPITPSPSPMDDFETIGIIEPPKGPDGNSLILNQDGVTWTPATLVNKYTNETINNATKNGTNTDSVYEQGLDAAISENQNTPLPTSNASPRSVGVGSGGDIPVPGSFTADSKLIGQQLWKYKVQLFNHSQKEYLVPTRAIKVLCIEDDLLSWPLRGYIIIDNRMEGFERAEHNDLYYFLRSDSRDEIHIDMWPEVEKGTLPDKIWRIKNTYVIYDVEDLAHTDMTLKAKKLYFWDKKFQFLLEKNIQWSTANGKRYKSSACPKPVAHATDKERAMFTGEAIASLLYAMGYEDYIDFNRWEWGKGKINFVAKADWSAWDCIQYLLTQQISDDEKNDICLLEWDRGLSKWTLQPVWKIFEKAGDGAPGELQIEHMFFEENVSGNLDMSPPKAPLDLGVSYEKDIKADEYNKIRNYRFSQPSGLDNSKAFLTKPLYSHWHKKKQFDVDVKENEIKYVKESYFKKNYIEGKVRSRGKYPVMAMNRTKEDQKSIDPQFSPISTLEPKNDRYIRSLEGRGKILFAGIFLNQNLVIRMTGSTHRLAGTFIGVDRAKSNSETIYDYQICGQYLVTNVKHIIQQQKFINELTMVKVHAFDVLPVNEGIE